MTEYEEMAQSLSNFKELWYDQGVLLAFATFPTQEQIDKVRKILDGIEQTNHDFPIAHG